MKEKIEQIMENFDFEKVHKVMVALEWEWYLGTWGGFGIPSVGAIQKAARRLLSEAWTNKTTVSTGGFSAEYDDGDLIFRFILEEWFSE